MGLLDFMNTPQGMGLLSAVAGGLAGARRGTPINNIGRGLTSGVVGYNAALEDQRLAANTAIADKYRSMQMQQIEQEMERARKQREWKANLPDILAPKLTGSTEQGRQLAEQNAVFGEEGLPYLVESAQYAATKERPDAPLNMNYGVDKQAVQQYMMHPDSPFADKLIEQQIMPKDPIKLGAGDVLLDPVTRQPLYAAPSSADKSPDKVRQYEYAKEQGYNGSFIDFLKIVPELQAAYSVPFKQAGLAIDRAGLDLREREADYTLPRGKPRQEAAPSFSVRAPDGNTYSFP